MNMYYLYFNRKDTSSNTVKVPSSASCNSEAAFLHLDPNCYAQNQQAAPNPVTPEYHMDSTNPYKHQKAVNSNLGDLGDHKNTGQDTFNSISVNDYRLDADYYKKNGRYLEEVI